MNKRTKVVLGVSAATVLLASAGAAVAHRGDWNGKNVRGEMVFEMLDANKDGKVTREEAETYRDQRIQQFDADKDGELNKAEYTAMVQDMMKKFIEERFDRQDADGSGTVNKTELTGRMDRMFDHLDKNGDGAVERTELRGRGHHDGGKHGGGTHRDGKG